MRAVVITEHGDASALAVQERPAPRCGPGQVRIAARAAGVNFADVLARKGLYPDAPKPPVVVGYEVSGVVDAVGAGVDPALIGSEVIALTRFGGYADVVSVPVGQVFAKPSGLSHE